MRVPPDHRMRRALQLLFGLILYGISDSMLVLARLGLDPWDVLHQGLARLTDMPIGIWNILVGVGVLLLWIPLGLRLGIGTVANAIIIGLTMVAVLAWVPVPSALWLRWLVMGGGIGLNGIATGAYIGAGLGPGPRDGLMVGLAARGYSIRAVRTVIEVTVVVVGWLLGGRVGVGTLGYALTIGPLAQLFIPWFTIPSRSDAVAGLASDGSAHGG